MSATVLGMAQKKHDPKATRMVRIPAIWAAALEEIASEELNNLTDQVKIAVREYLEKRNRLPRPGQKKS